MSSKEKPVQGEAGAWRVRPHDTDLSAARVINDARLAESMAAHRWLVEPLTELPTPAEPQPQGVAVGDAMVERACRAYFPGWETFHPEAWKAPRRLGMRAAITAALAQQANKEQPPNG